MTKIPQSPHSVSFKGINVKYAHILDPKTVEVLKNGFSPIEKTHNVNIFPSNVVEQGLNGLEPNFTAYICKKQNGCVCLKYFTENRTN